MIKRFLILGVFALVGGAVVRFATAPTAAVALSSADKSGVAVGEAMPPPAPTADAARRGNWQLAWTRPTPDLQSLSLSRDGSTVAWVDRSGSVRRINVKTGDTVFRSDPSPGINYVTAASGGCVIAASRLNRLKPTVHIFDATPFAASHVSICPVDGAVWTMSVSEQGNQVIIGTGKSRLMLLPLANANSAVVGTQLPSSEAPMEMTESGIPGSIQIAANSPILIDGTWQDSGVCAWGLDGKLLWRHEGTEPDRTYEVHVSGDGSTAVAVSSKQPGGTDARIHVWDAKTGRLIWRQDLNAYDAHALVSANGDSIVASFAKEPDDDGSPADTPGTVERKVVLFDRLGHRKFADKGGMFFSPQLIALSRDGRRISVRDNAGYIWTLDDQGRVLSRIRLSLDPTTGSSPTIKEAIASDDASTLLVRRGDGQISLFRSAAK